MRNTLQNTALVFGLVAASLAAAEVRELPSIAGLRAEVGAETLLIFDLDNTLIEPKQTLGSDQWFSHLVKGQESRGVPHEAAVDAAIATWMPVQLKTSMRLVESITSSEVHAYQSAGIRVMGLTARPTGLAQATIDQLRSVGIDFSRSAGIPDGLAIDANGVAGLAFGGVIFAGPTNDKGKVLLNYLQKLRLAPLRIVFVDDKVNNVRNVEAALAPSGLPYIGLRYGAADARVKAFDPAVAEIQLKYFLELMDDDTAAKLKTGARPLRVVF